jgi:energy-coupling factor transporter ATP-binding protein EcfA2
VELEACSLVSIVEYVAERLRLTAGEQRVTFELSDGKVRRARIAREPIGAVELEHLARP